VIDLPRLFSLVSHGPDTFVGEGAQYEWGGLYGGHIVAQALRAAAATVEPGLTAHSLRAYFIRRGDASEPVRYEVDRIRNGRSFSTRRVVARQAVGAILNLEASFQAGADGRELAPIVRPEPPLPPPEGLTSDGWSPAFERRWVPPAAVDAAAHRDGAGRVIAWMKASGELGDDPLLHQCAVAYMSDDLPCDTVIQAIPDYATREQEENRDLFVASLDHTIWFHAPFRADEWHVHDFSCQRYVGSRGLALGHLFDGDGRHVATVAQEALVRDRRVDPSG
jgi:acyl-CoA thioesterase-2